MWQARVVARQRVSHHGGGIGNYGTLQLEDVTLQQNVADNDNDGVRDALDACDDEPEDLDGVDDEDGCPESS